MASGVSQRKLERLTRRGEIAKLRRLLADRDLRRTPDGAVVDLNWQSRVRTIFALAEIDHADAEDAVASALEDTVEGVRHAAVDVLAASGSPTALPRLAYVCATWTDTADPARLAALSVLAEAVNKTAAVRYVEGLLSTDSLLPPDALDEAVVRCFVEVDSANFAEDLAGSLVPQLASEDEGRAGRAEAILSWLGNIGVQAAEKAALEIDGAAASAARVLGTVGEESSVPTLRQVLEHGTRSGERQAAAMALAELRTPLAIEPLLVATRDPSREVRDAALFALDTYGVMATGAIIRGVIRPGQDSVLQLARTEQELNRYQATGPDGWRSRIRGLLRP
jgi:HEAT repeat protein